MKFRSSHCNISNGLKNDKNDSYQDLKEYFQDKYG